MTTLLTGKIHTHTVLALGASRTKSIGVVRGAAIVGIDGNAVARHTSRSRAAKSGASLGGAHIGFTHEGAGAGHADIAGGAAAGRIRLRAGIRCDGSHAIAAHTGFPCGAGAILNHITAGAAV